MHLYSVPTGKGRTYSDVSEDGHVNGSSEGGVLVETRVGVEPIVGVPVGTGATPRQAVHIVISTSHNTPETRKFSLYRTISLSHLDVFLDIRFIVEKPPWQLLYVLE